MKIIHICVLPLLSCNLLLAGKGTVPRAQVSSYPSHVEIEGAGAGAALLKESEVKQRFATDLSREYLVLEVALYPPDGGKLDVQTDSCILRINGKEPALRPEDPKVIASLLKYKVPQKRGVQVIPHAGVGYESGRRYPSSGYPDCDPNFGCPGYGTGGVYSSAGVGVVLGESKPAGTPMDQEIMVAELSDKSLPEGQTDKPVAGYLYFRIDRNTQKNHSSRYSLEFDLRGKTAVLQLSN